MYKGTQLENSQAKPTIYVEDISDSQLKLQVTHNKPLEKVTYSWNNEEAVDLNAKGKKKCWANNRNSNRRKYFICICRRPRWKRNKLSKNIY